MLPLSYQMPAAVALIAGGIVTCFAGYRLFRFVLGAYGFILGALLASSMVGTSETWALAMPAVPAKAAMAAAMMVRFSFMADLL